MSVLVVHKVPKIEHLRATAPEVVEQLRERDAAAYAAMEDSAVGHRRSVEAVVSALQERGADHQVLSRDDFSHVDNDVDLVVAVGGDGTVLDVSHRVLDVPLLGINSDPERSVGYFCACDASGAGPVFDRHERAEAEIFALHRIAIAIDGEEHPFPCMNDVLVTNHNPAMMSRYELTAGTRSEKHASSGLWIATPAGSTGGIRSAGGTVMPLEGALIQYLVREPYMPAHTHYELLRGVRHLGEGLAIKSLMPGGRIYIDGPYIQADFGMGSVLTVTEGPVLQVVGLDPQLRER